MDDNLMQIVIQLEGDDEIGIYATEHFDYEAIPVILEQVAEEMKRAGSKPNLYRVK